ncbi:MAG TPA: CRTAC1 family protein [Planctomycetota bacterium]|nr:CRTAC1 family protein [Planctomycetota bacterium]
MLPPYARRGFALFVFAALLGGAHSLDGRTLAINAPGDPESSEAPFHMREVAREIGIAFTHVPFQTDPRIAHIQPHVAGVGAAVSCTDFDGDGWVDLYATSSAAGTHNALLRNLGDGHFEDVAVKAGLADVNSDQGASMGSVWADADQDGDEECFLYKYGRPQLFRNDRGVFVDVTRESGLDRWINSNAALWFDYDRDGLIDLYIAGYFRESVNLFALADTRIMQESFQFAKNGGHNYLFHNLGGLRFEDVTQAMGADSTRWTLAVASADFDRDGWPDLYLANDYGPEELFLNREGKSFEAAPQMLDGRSKSGMSVAIGDTQNDGDFGVYVTNITNATYLQQGNNLRVRSKSSDRFLNIARDEVANCGWAWGSAFGDLDLDGHQDLFVVNGFVSASETRDYWYDLGKIAGSQKGVFEDARNWPAFEDKSLSGRERSRVLVWSDGRLRDRAFEVGVRDLLDGRAVVLADLSNRGVLDAVIANQCQPLSVYRNEVPKGRHWMQFKLVGTRSNTSAIGATVCVSFAGGEQLQVVSGGSGMSSQNDRRLLFGLGSDEHPKSARITWPDGSQQVMDAPGVDRLHEVVEGAR